ncbi:MAG: RnfH family protein [Marinobacter sp.]|uniref:RnfH family protein n=1 Tax=Marinobacter sp. TaxID=50741 RepID=UPI0034A09B4C
MLVEVAYAKPEKQQILRVEVHEGATAFEAAMQSGIVSVFPEIDLETVDMGIFGKVVKAPKAHELRDGDRVELYRPLKIDPKQARLNRARKKPDASQ